MTTQPKMEIKELPLSDLKPASYNPRKKLKKGDKEYEKIKQSLLKFGYVDPIIVNEDLTVIGGHQRLTVLKDLKYETAKCVIVSLSKEDEKALNIALNKITGQWDDQLLADLLLDLQESDFNLDLTGFEPPEIDDILSNVHDKDLTEDDFDVEEELKKPTVARRGDIWQLGKHRVICGDSTKAETYDQLLGDKKANLVVTDPPYNVNVEETAGKILNDNMSDGDFYQVAGDEIISTISLSWMKQGTTLNGKCSTQKTTEFPKTENVSTLSDILEVEVDDKYYLSAEKAVAILSNL